MTRDELDLAIVGAGIVGAACAFAAANEGLRVAIVDSGPPAGGTTSAGMGHVVALDSSPQVLALARYSQRLWREIGPHLPPSAGYRESGTLWIAGSEEELQIAERRSETLHAAGIPAERLDPEEIAVMEPLLREGLHGGLLVPEDLLVDPPAATRYLLDIVRDRGGRIELGRTVRAIRPGRIEGDLGFELRARGVVNAAGVRAPELTPRVPIAPRKGHLLHLQGGRERIRHQVVELRYGAGVRSSEPVAVAFNLHPRADGSVLVGASRETGPRDGAVDPAVVERLRAKVREFAPRLDSWPTLGAWTGLRPASADHLPWIGPWPEEPGVWLATGHEGLGVTAALGTGRLLVDQFLGRPTAIPAEPYRPTAERIARTASGPAPEDAR